MPVSATTRAARVRRRRRSRQALAQRAAQVDARGLAGRRQAEEDAGGHGEHESEGEHAPVHRRLSIPSVPAGASSRRPCTAQYASATPAAPPIRDSDTLSTSSCRTSRRRAAPSAARMAISRRRDALFASSRLATFAHAMSRTQAMAPNSTRTAATDGTDHLIAQELEAHAPALVRVGVLRGPAGPRSCRAPPARPPASRRRPAGRRCAGSGSAGPAPRRRAAAEASRPPRPWGNGSRRASRPPASPRARRARAGAPARRESPPNRRCQRAWLTTATRGWSSCSSAGTKPRPSAGRTPSTVEEPRARERAAHVLRLALAGKRGRVVKEVIAATRSFRTSRR